MLAFSFSPQIIVYGADGVWDVGGTGLSGIYLVSLGWFCWAISCGHLISNFIVRFLCAV